MTLILFLFSVALVFHAKLWGFFDFGNPIVFMLDYHLFFLSLGVFVYYFNIYPAYHIENLTLILVLLSYVITVFSAAVTYLVLGSAVRLRFSSTSYQRFTFRLDARANRFADILWAVGVLLTVVVAVRSGFSALLSLAADGGFEDERVAAMSGNGIFVIPAQLFLLIGAAWSSIRQDRHFLIKVFVFFVSAACMISFGFRSGIAFLVVICGIAKLYTKFGKIPVLKSAILAVVVLSCFVLLGVLRKGGGDVFERFAASFFWRSFVTVWNLDVILTQYKDFLSGGGILMELAVIVPGPDVNLGAHLKEALGYDFPGGGITPSYVGAGFVDFGMLGAVLYPAITGCLVAFFYIVWPLLVGRGGLSFILLLIFSVTTSGVAAAGFVSPYLYFGVPLLILGVVGRFMISSRLRFQACGIKQSLEKPNYT
ncbi:hypothetical protein [Pseudomonas putida]|uniref:hypothetical protein n=1 Tax=Pseudomonas putida TaxID=303 RepID=UPI0037CAAB5A